MAQGLLTTIESSANIAIKYALMEFGCPKRRMNQIVLLRSTFLTIKKGQNLLNSHSKNLLHNIIMKSAQK